MQAQSQEIEGGQHTYLCEACGCNWIIERTVEDIKADYPKDLWKCPEGRSSAV